MTAYRVVFRREPLQQLDELYDYKLYDYIADTASPDGATRY